MLSEPKHGWSAITIGNWTDRCSYLDDVPFLLLKGLEKSCRTHRPVAAKFDAEGWEYIIVFDWIESYIITDKCGKPQLISVPVGRDNIAKELVSDIRKNIDGWSAWIDYGDMPVDEREKRKKDLLMLCDILEKRIPSPDYKLIYRGGES